MNENREPMGSKRAGHSVGGQFAAARATEASGSGLVTEVVEPDPAVHTQDFGVAAIERGFAGSREVYDVRYPGNGNAYVDLRHRDDSEQVLIVEIDEYGEVLSTVAFVEANLPYRTENGELLHEARYRLRTQRLVSTGAAAPVKWVEGADASIVTDTFPWVTDEEGAPVDMSDDAVLFTAAEGEYCEGCGAMGGVVVAVDIPESVQRCGSCNRYASDLEAADALSGRLTAGWGSELSVNFYRDLRGQ